VKARLHVFFISVRKYSASCPSSVYIGSWDIAESIYTSVKSWRHNKCINFKLGDREYKKRGRKILNHSFICRLQSAVLLNQQTQQTNLLQEDKLVFSQYSDPFNTEARPSMNVAIIQSQFSRYHASDVKSIPVHISSTLLNSRSKFRSQIWKEAQYKPVLLHCSVCNERVLMGRFYLIVGEPQDSVLSRTSLSHLHFSQQTCRSEVNQTSTHLARTCALCYAREDHHITFIAYYHQNIQRFKQPYN
jgi:hypothetical protein